MSSPDAYKVASQETINYKSADFIHVVNSLYVVLTPLSASGQDTAIEELFDAVARNTVVSGKTFNPSDGRDLKIEYGKANFAKKVVQANKTTINFSGLRPLLDRIILANQHYDTVK